MQTLLGEAASILTPQRNGFLASGPYPFTHALSAYLGCGYGKTTCGLYCYAQYLPNWQFRGFPASWGETVQVKTNAPELLQAALSSTNPAARRRMRVFMSSTTDPYQPIERRHEVTRRCLDVFTRYPDLDLLVVQTRSPLAERDLPLLRDIPYAWLSITIESDDQHYLTGLRGGPSIERRWALVRAASNAGVPVQITVSPSLTYANVERFGERLLASGARRVVVDTPVDGDGSAGKRTGRSPFARAEPRWRDTSHAHRLFEWLCEHATAEQVHLGWSTGGFCGVPPRQLTVTTSSSLAHP